MDDLFVYGLDFTSSPSRNDAKGDSAKWLTLAKCRLTGNSLQVESLTRLNSEAANDFTAYGTWLKTRGEWIAGIKTFRLVCPSLQSNTSDGWIGRQLALGTITSSAFTCRTRT